VGTFQTDAARPAAGSLNIARHPHAKAMSGLRP